MLLRSLVVILTLMLGTSALAFDYGNLRLGGIAGFGSGGAKEDDTVRTEKPLALSFLADYSLNSRHILGMEHKRSFSGSTTSIGLTGIVWRWYFHTPHPQKLRHPSDIVEGDLILQKNYVPYFGLSAGFAQANFPKRITDQNAVAVVGPYVSLKGGLEYPLTGSWGLRSELAISQTVMGNGYVEMIHLFFGFYYFL